MLPSILPSARPTPSESPMRTITPIATHAHSISIAPLGLGTNYCARAVCQRFMVPKAVRLSFSKLEDGPLYHLAGRHADRIGNECPPGVLTPVSSRTGFLPDPISPRLVVLTRPGREEIPNGTGDPPDLLLGQFRIHRQR